MLKKYVLLFVIIFACIGFYVAGLLSPDSFRSGASSFIGTENADILPSENGAEAVAAGSSEATESTADAKEPTPADESPPVDMASLRLPLNPAPESRFGLQIRKFTSAESCNPLMERVAKLNFPPARVRGLDEFGVVWHLVITGPYIDRREADHKRERLLGFLSSGFDVKVILYPE